MEKEKTHQTIKLKIETFRRLRKRKLIMEVNRPTDKPLTWDDFLEYLSRRADQ